MFIDYNLGWFCVSLFNESPWKHLKNFTADVNSLQCCLPPLTFFFSRKKSAGSRVQWNETESNLCPFAWHLLYVFDVFPQRMDEGKDKRWPGMRQKKKVFSILFFFLIQYFFLGVRLFREKRGKEKKTNAKWKQKFVMAYKFT